MANIKPFWWILAGLVLLYLFLLVVLPRGGGMRPYPGPRPYPFPGGGLLGPGGVQRRFYEGFAGAPAATMTMFGVDWCPHCVSAKPIFESLGSTMTIGGQDVVLRVINPEKDKSAAAGYELDGYPTFYFEKAGQRQKYSGPRTKDGFLQFLQQQMS
jgi:glutaredoxin